MWYFVAKIEGFSPDSWVVRRGILDEPNFTKYVNSLYWTYATMATVGYGDIHGETSLEKLLAILVMIFGV
jgi:hypothetical protein